MQLKQELQMRLYDVFKNPINLIANTLHSMKNEVHIV